MRRLLTFVLAALAVMAMAVPASAARGVNPVEYCKSVYQTQTSPVTGEEFDAYLIPVEFSFGGETAVEPFALSSFQACVSTVASGMRGGVVPASKITTPAYLAQCDYLEAAGFISYPYAFYGVYDADNRADCVRILKGVHSGELELPQPPPVG